MTTGALLAVTAVGLAAPAAGLAAPADRVAELVSRGDGNMGDVVRVTAATDVGDAVLSMATAATEEARGAQFISGTLWQRTPMDWLAQPVDPVGYQLMGGPLRLYRLRAISDDLKRVLVWSWAPLVPEDLDGSGPDLYLVDVVTGKATWITHAAEGSPPANGSSAMHFAGASADLRTIYFRSAGESLDGSAPTTALYKWQDDHIEAVSLLPGGAYPDLADPATWPRTPNLFKTHLFAPDAPRLAHNGSHGVSDDGTTFFFQAGSAAGQGLYARRGSTTISVDGSHVSGHDGELAIFPSTFVGASHDGDVVYFVHDAQLTDTGSATGGLFRYTLSTGELEQLTDDAGPGGLGVTDALMSDDASRVYFVASAALTPEAQAGIPNVYVQVGDETRYIATIPDGGRVERTSRSGRFAVIQTTSSIAGATTNGNSTLYEYDDADGSLACVSCRADGSPSEGPAALEDEGAGGLSSGLTDSTPRNITDDGSVFFASHDRLVPDDLSSAADTYEYSDGALQLLSSGTSAYDSYIQDNNDDGRNAYFLTRASMVPEDNDRGLQDLYDARIGGGLPRAVRSTPSCDGSDCEGLAGRPTLRTPATDRAATPAPIPGSGPKRGAVKKTFRVAGISAADRRRLARGRAVALSVTVMGGGRLSVTSSAKVGRRNLLTGSALRIVSQRSRVTTHVRFRLSAAARQALARRGALRVRLVVRLSGVADAKRISVPLTRPAR